MYRYSFLQQVAQHYYKLFGKDISQKTFVFPSKRSLQFFRHYLSQEAKTPIFSPECITVNDFLSSLLPERRTLDHTALLFELYHSYRKVREGQELESFDEFVYWGNIILKDFDLIDRYLISAKELYTNLSDFKELQDDFSYMQEETLDILHGFWKNFKDHDLHTASRPDASLSSRERFLSFWLSLYPLYKHFNDQLLKCNYAYEGGLYRAIAEDAIEIVDRLPQQTSLIFVGLFDITPSEFRIFRTLRMRGYAEFCWDEHVHILSDKQHRAHRMMQKNKELLGYEQGSWYRTGHTLPSEVEVISCASTVSQVKALPQVLTELGLNLELEEHALGLTTAIILPHDSLLLPTVGSIPSGYKHLNVTLGYPLSRTPIAIMISRWAELLQDMKGSYRVDNLLSLLSIQILVERFPSLIRLTERIGRQRSFRLSTEWVHQHYEQLLKQWDKDDGKSTEPPLEGYSNIMQLLLPTTMGPLDFLAALRELLSVILTSSRLLRQAGEEIEEETDIYTEEDGRPVLSIFDAEFIHHYILLVNRLYSLIEEYHLHGMSLAATSKLLEGLSQGFTIPFEGHPLQGLQIMGLLESRALHFKHLIYLSAQEGLIPTDRHSNTLIPHALRVGYRLPTAEWQEAADSYRFYQSISGVEKLIMLYGKEDNTGGKGEESRYILQMEFLYGVPIRRRTAQVTPRLTAARPIVVDKQSTAVLAQLARYFSQDEDHKSLSASRLSTYISCPLRFYYEAIQEIYEEQTPQELIAANDFGSILHRTIEKLYAPYIGGKFVPKHDIKRMLEEGNTLISRTVRESYSKQYDRNTLSALDKLYCNMIDTYIRSILQYDMLSKDEFAYLDSEGRFEGQLELSDGRLANIKGDIDRLDILYPEGDKSSPRLRLIDYKTGSDKLSKIGDWNKLIQQGDHKARMQILLYCELVHSGKAHKTLFAEVQRSYPIQPAVMLVRQMAHEQANYNPYLTYGMERGQGSIIDNYLEYRANFLDVMKTLLDELFDLSIPFTQTEDKEQCRYCPFALSCGR